MATIFFGSKLEHVIPPEEDIQEVILMAKNWLEKNPEREFVKIAIFGHHCETIRAGHIEEDVRESAKTATKYYK